LTDRAADPDRYEVRDANGFRLASVYFRDDLGKWSFGHSHLTSDEARRIAKTKRRDCRGRGKTEFDKKLRLTTRRWHSSLTWQKDGPVVATKRSRQQHEMKPILGPCVVKHLPDSTRPMRSAGRTAPAFHPRRGRFPAYQAKAQSCSSVLYKLSSQGEFGIGTLVDVAAPLFTYPALWQLA